MSDLGAEIKRLAARRWERDPDPTADLPPIAGPADGPAWTINLIEQDANSAKVLQLAGFARVNGLVSLILDDIRGPAKKLPFVPGVLVLGPRLPSEANPDEPKRTDDALARRLLAATGTFLPDPVPQEFQHLLRGQDSIFSIEADGLPFTIRRLRP